MVIFGVAEAGFLVLKQKIYFTSLDFPLWPFLCDIIFEVCSLAVVFL